MPTVRVSDIDIFYRDDDFADPWAEHDKVFIHENRTTTEIYLHSIGQSEREAMKVFEKNWVRVPHKSHMNNKKGATGIGKSSVTP